MAFRVALSGVDCEIECADSGAEALKILQNMTVAVVVLDVQMPGMDGFEVARRMRSREQTAETPILFVTALDPDHQRLEEAYDVGATDYITKPVSARILAAKVKTFVDLHRKSEALARATTLLAESAEAEKSTILEFALDGVVAVDQDSKVIFWNKNAEAIFGWTKEETLGHDMTELIVPPEYREAHRAGMKRFLATHVPTIQNRRIEIPGLRKSGETFPLELTVSSVKSKAGYRFYSFMRDITEQKAARDESRNQFKWLELILNKVDAAIVLVDPETQEIVFTNEAADRLTGGRKQTNLDFASFHFIGDDDKPIPRERWPRTRAARGETISGETFRWKTPDGIRELLVYAGPIPAVYGRERKILICLVDVTELRETERRLRETALDLKLKSDALENSLNGFDIVDHEGRLIYANKSYLRMWGFDSADEILGKSPASHCADPETPGKIIQSLKSTGQCDIEFLARRKDGSTFDVRMLAFLAHDASGNEIYPTTSVDITEQKKAAKALLHAKEEAERASRLKSAFLANMSHEIRTPLGAMIGFADLLRNPELSEKQKLEYLEILTRNGENLAVIINDILDLSKVEAGHLQFELVETDVAQIAGDIVSLLRVKATEKSLRLSIEIDPSTPRSITSDPMRVRQILLNLIGNAIKFTPAGSVHVKTSARESKRGRNGVCIEIVDTGIGIPEGQRDQVFEMFVQADGSMTRRFGGTGLGLALSRSLARSLGGDVSILESSQGKGSTFVLSLEDLARSESARAQPASTAAPPPSLGTSDLGGVRILVVDDSPDNRQLISLYLRKQHALVDTAEDGRVGYEKALAGDYDVVLMDIQMPEMDGYTATERLRSHGFRKPIIALTAHAMSEVRQRCLDAGCTDHLPKPIKPKELIATIATHTSH